MHFSSNVLVTGCNRIAGNYRIIEVIKGCRCVCVTYGDPPFLESLKRCALGMEYIALDIDLFSGL